MPAFGRARVEQEIVKVPQHEVVVSFRPAQIARPRGIDAEQDAAVGEQREQRVADAALCPAERLDRLRRDEPRDAGRDLRVANPKQRAGARQFQHEIVGAPPQVGEARQHEHVGIVERGQPRPVVGHLRLDHDHVRAVPAAREAVFEETVRGEPSHQPGELLVAVGRGRRERIERKAIAELPRPRRRVGAERSELDRVAGKAGGGLAVRPDVEGDVLAQPREQFRALPGLFADGGRAQSLSLRSAAARG